MKTITIPFNTTSTILAVLGSIVLLKMVEAIGVDPSPRLVGCDCPKVAQLETELHEVSKQIESMKETMAAFLSAAESDTWLRAPLVGPPGPKGEPGTPGISGVNGAKGERGSKGDEGAVGAQGQQGVRGPKGSTGDVGPRGTEGDPGNVGPVGPSGYNGRKGDKGDQGPNGAQGPKGERGAYGPKGDVGPPGVKGDRGSTGSVGPKGEKGVNGSQGDNSKCIKYNDTIKLFTEDERKVLDHTWNRPFLSEPGEKRWSQHWKIRTILGRYTE